MIWFYTWNIMMTSELTRPKTASQLTFDLQDLTLQQPIRAAAWHQPRPQN